MATDFINSNIALFGSDLEHKVKETAAKSAIEWQNFEQELQSPQAPNLFIWRIEKFHVVPWPRNLYGTFYDGDSYIVCLVIRDTSGKIKAYNLHFWIGSKSTIDEAGVAAYKTVELDTFLGGIPVQYRESQGSETDLFKSYFHELTIIPGGIDSGFRHISDDEHFATKFYSIHDHTTQTSDPGKMNLTEDDVFVLDTGRNIYIYEGSQSSHIERWAATILINQIKAHRKDVQVTRDKVAFSTLHSNLKFYNLIPSQGRTSHAALLSRLQVHQPSGKPLPSSVDFRTLGICSPVKNQGQLGSCTGQSITSAMETVELKEKLTLNILSPLFVYWHERQIEGTVNEDSGAAISDGIHVVCTRGVCSEILLPYKDSGDYFTKKPSTACEKDALNNVDTDNIHLAAVNITVDDIKDVLAQHNPVVFGANLYDSFESDEVAKTGVVPMPNTRKEQLLGGHAIVFVGYDDSKKAFLVKNSWGTDWGESGYCWLPYDYIKPSLISEVFKITSVGKRTSSSTN